MAENKHNMIKKLLVIIIALLVRIKNAVVPCCQRRDEESLEQVHWDNRGDPKVLQMTIRRFSERLSAVEKQLQMALSHCRCAFADDSNNNSKTEDNGSEDRMSYQDIDIRFQLLETANYAGVLMWKIRDYALRKARAVSGDVLSLYSQPFYTSQFGYKMCARVYLNGDGLGKGSHLSVFFVVMKGNYDALLVWPFQLKVTMTVLDQVTGRYHVTDSFRPDPMSTSFQRPKTEMNVASGCPLFLAQSVLEAGLYTSDDTIFIKVTVDTDGIKDP